MGTSLVQNDAVLANHPNAARRSSQIPAKELVFPVGFSTHHLSALQLGGMPPALAPIPSIPPCIDCAYLRSPIAAKQQARAHRHGANEDRFTLFDHDRYHAIR